ncbi:FMN-binding protein [Cryobacterium sp. M15]|uniref:FMN-binding protein n=1 Tax=Cryobacterium sp. M15 TaxID=2048291 RepID=UPI000CE46162|nr:FMN-binding protein [Cryobacterium sp. M15]
MRARAVALATLASVSIVGIGWQLGSSAIEASQSLTASSGGTAWAAAASAAQAAAQSGTFTGAVVPTQYGNMQVSVTLANGAITEVTPLQLTNRGGRSAGISNQAAPILRSEVLTAQSANVHNVSGATYTSEGYLRSLQSALDTAGF